jgi:hypothetical protein
MAGNRRNDHSGHHDHGWNAGDVRGFAASQFDTFNASMRRADADAAQADRSANAIRASVEEHGHAAAIAVEKTSGAIGVAIQATAAAGQLATNVAGQQVQNMLLQQSNLAAVQAQTFAAALNLAIETKAAAALMDATKNSAAVLAAQAACCCEIKEKIGDEANRTRELMLKLDGDGAARREAALAAQVQQLQLVATLGGRGRD